MSGPGPVSRVGHAARAVETAPEREAAVDGLRSDLRKLRPDLDIHPVGDFWVALPAGTPFKFSRTLPRLEDKVADWVPGDVTARPQTREAAP